MQRIHKQTLTRHNRSRTWGEAVFSNHDKLYAVSQLPTYVGSCNCLFVRFFFSLTNLACESVFVYISHNYMNIQFCFLLRPCTQHIIMCNGFTSAKSGIKQSAQSDELWSWGRSWLSCRLLRQCQHCFFSRALSCPLGKSFMEFFSSSRHKRVINPWSSSSCFASSQPQDFCPANYVKLNTVGHTGTWWAVNCCISLAVVVHQNVLARQLCHQGFFFVRREAVSVLKRIGCNGNSSHCVGACRAVEVCNWTIEQ